MLKVERIAAEPASGLCACGRRSGTAAPGQGRPACEGASTSTSCSWRSSKPRRRPTRSRPRRPPPRLRCRPRWSGGSPCASPSRPSGRAGASWCRAQPPARVAAAHACRRWAELARFHALRSRVGWTAEAETATGRVWVGLRTRRPTLRRYRSPGGPVPLLARPTGRAPAGASHGLDRGAPGRRLRGLRQAVPASASPHRSSRPRAGPTRGANSSSWPTSRPRHAGGRNRRWPSSRPWRSRPCGAWTSCSPSSAR